MPGSAGRHFLLCVDWEDSWQSKWQRDQTCAGPKLRLTPDCCLQVTWGAPIWRAPAASAAFPVANKQQWRLEKPGEDSLGWVISKANGRVLLLHSRCVNVLLLWSVKSFVVAFFFFTSGSAVSCGSSEKQMEPTGVSCKPINKAGLGGLAMLRLTCWISI